MAVVSQPSNRTADVKLPGKLDEKLGEFWVGNPFAIVRNQHNLSSFERNRMYLNVGGSEFVEVSGISGADSDGDGRSAVAADFRNTGQPDLIVRQVGGGPLLLYENRLPAKHYLTVSLRGTASNRRGIGARLTAEVNGRRIVRELYPANTYRSQTPTQVLFGLADDATVDKLTIRWPSGTEQVLTGVKADRHVVVTEGKTGADAVETVTPGQTIRP
jgi:enediyne biosynthesis protein E4